MTATALKVRVRAVGLPRLRYLIRQLGSTLDDHRRLALEIAEVFAHQPDRFIQFRDIDGKRGPARRAANVRIAIEPTDRFVQLTAALRALNRDLRRIQRLHVGPSGGLVKRSRSEPTTGRARRARQEGQHN